MNKPNKIQLPNKTAKLFYILNLISFWSGQPNFWIENLPVPKIFINVNRFISRIVSVLIYSFLLSECLAVFTEKNWTPTQESNLMVFIISHPILWSYSVSCSRQAHKVKKVLADILDLKRVHNDEEVEKQMIRKSKLYISAFAGMVVVAMTMYTFDAIVVVTKTDGTFSPIITAWPSIEDTSASANALRVLWNMMWWWMMSRVVSVYGFVFSVTSCMSHQFVDLQSYFNSLNNIFADNRLSQRRKELKYEAAYKIGIKLHSDTLKCVKLSKSIFSWQFNGQIIFNITMLVMLMAQFTKIHREVMRAVAIGIAAISVILGTGLFMCNAGDVTVEASNLCTAMYSSGWQHCQGRSSVRIRKLVMISMTFAQRPVIIKGLGVMSLSYESFVSLVKTTYSVFSVVIQKAS